jgi:mRNA-degrading endonuclease RelE of RelBE toxin-antitoxin system
MRVTMSIEELVIEKLRGLPPDQRKEVLDFVEFLQEKKGAKQLERVVREVVDREVELLKEKKGSKQPLRSLHGLWADLGVEISEKDITDARREMWSTFPRESF